MLATWGLITIPGVIVAIASRRVSQLIALFLFPVSACSDRVEREIAALDVDADFQLSCLYTGRFCVLRKHEWRPGARLLRVEHPWARLSWS